MGSDCIGRYEFNYIMTTVMETPEYDWKKSLGLFDKSATIVSANISEFYNLEQIETFLTLIIYVN